MPNPSTPRADQARLALVGPRSGPPCFKEPPTTVGATSFAIVRHSRAPLQPFELIKSYKTSPTVGGGDPNPSGHEKCSANCLWMAMKTVLGRNCGTPKSHAFIKFQPTS